MVGETATASLTDFALAGWAEHFAHQHPERQDGIEKVRPHEWRSHVEEPHVPKPSWAGDENGDAYAYGEANLRNRPVTIKGVDPGEHHVRSTQCRQALLDDNSTNAAAVCEKRLLAIRAFDCNEIAHPVGVFAVRTPVPHRAEEWANIVVPPVNSARENWPIIQAVHLLEANNQRVSPTLA